MPLSELTTACNRLRPSLVSRLITTHPAGVDSCGRSPLWILAMISRVVVQLAAGVESLRFSQLESGGAQEAGSQVSVDGELRSGLCACAYQPVHVPPHCRQASGVPSPCQGWGSHLPGGVGGLPVRPSTSPTSSLLAYE